MPYRIGLGAMLLLAVAYFTFLKPKDDAAPAPSPAASSAAGPLSAVDKAKGAVAASDASAAATQAASGQASGDPAAPATPAAPSSTQGAAPAESATAGMSAKDALAKLGKGDPSAAILRQLAAGKTAVVLVSSPVASEDAHIRRALSSIDLHRGKVTVHRIPVADIGRYDGLTRGVQITHSPTLLVIGDDLKARQITGFTTRAEINQLVNDVSGLRTRLRPSSYRKLVQSSCATTTYNIVGDIKALADIFGDGARLAAVREDLQRLGKRLRAADVPARYGSFHSAYRQYVTSLQREIGSVTPAMAANPYGERFQKVMERLSELDASINSKAKPLGLRCKASV